MTNLEPKVVWTSKDGNYRVVAWWDSEALAGGGKWQMEAETLHVDWLGKPAWLSVPEAQLTRVFRDAVRELTTGVAR